MGIVFNGHNGQLGGSAVLVLGICKCKVGRDMRRTAQYISAVCQQHRISLDDGFEALLIFSQMTL
jgi:hypothetical protein